MKRLILSAIGLVALLDLNGCSDSKKETVGAVIEKKKKAIEHTYIDKKTNLMWDDTKRDFYLADLKGYYDRDFFCQSLKIKNYTDWRVPTLDELKSLYKNKEQLNYKLLGRKSVVWSSKEYTFSTNETRYYLLDFKNGKVETTFDKVLGYTVKCVRSIN